MEISCSHCFLSKLDKQEGRVHWDRWYIYWSRKAAVEVMVSLCTFCCFALLIMHNTTTHTNTKTKYNPYVSFCAFTHPILLRSVTKIPHTDTDPDPSVSFPLQSKGNTNKMYLKKKKAKSKHIEIVGTKNKNDDENDFVYLSG